MTLKEKIETWVWAQYQYTVRDSHLDHDAMKHAEARGHAARVNDVAVDLVCKIIWVPANRSQAKRAANIFHELAHAIDAEGRPTPVTWIRHHSNEERVIGIQCQLAGEFGNATVALECCKEFQNL